MALEQITFNLGALDDAANSGKNYVAGQVFEVFNIDDTYADIFADSAGTIPIDQSGVQNISNSDGECKFFIDKGFYNIKSGGKTRQLNANFSFEFETVSDAINARFISLLEGRRVFISERGGDFLILLTSAVTPNAMDVIQSVANPLYSMELVRVGGSVIVEQLGLSDLNDSADNQSIIARAFELAVFVGEIHFRSGKDKVYDTNKVTITSPINVSGNFPTLRNTATGSNGTVFYYNISGPIYVKVGGVNFRGDTDQNQLIKHHPDGDPDFNDNFHIFADYEWNAGTVTESVTGFTNTLSINNDPATVKAGVHTRGGRLEVDDLVQIEGFEAGIYLEGTSLANIGQNARIRFCEAGIQTRADRNNSNLKATMLNTNQTVIEYCYVGSYQNELQDSIYYNTFITRCCIPTVSRNTTNVTHKKGYFELTHNMIDCDGSFQKSEVYEDCQWSFVNANAPFIKRFGFASNNLNQSITFIRPDIKFNGGSMFSVDVVSDYAKIIFDRRYDYLPASADWLYINSELNIPWHPDPKFTRGGFGVASGSSATVTHISDYDNGSYLEIVGNGVGADLNGAQVLIYPIDNIPDNDVLDIRIGYEYQYDDEGSGDSILYPFGAYIGGAHRSPAENLTGQNGITASDQWKRVERSYKTSGNLSGTRFSGGFTGTLRIRNFYISIGTGHARSYQSKPSFWVVDAIPTTGDWQRSDEVQFRDPTTATYKGAICSVSGSPGTWRNFGAYEA